MTPEQKARKKIDQLLQQAGWIIQDMKDLNWMAGKGIAVREYYTNSGPADYILFIDAEPIGVIEAKRIEEGENLSKVEEQTSRYATSGLKWTTDDKELYFCYESTGVITHFTDRRDPKPAAREIFSFHQPETLAEFLKEGKSLRHRLHDIPELDYEGLRECQTMAIKELEQSFKKAKPRALVQMATGSGKTFTAISSIYRLLKYAKAKRVLFLVDTKNLGKQAESEFARYAPPDDKRKFNELYGVQRLRSRFIDDTSKVCISTIQRLYAILKGEELDEGAEERNPNEFFVKKEPLPVVYNHEISPEFFDFIIIDECHRSIYNLWRQVLEYFDAFLIGLTATPDNRTYGFFHENVVSEYKYEEAVSDGVLVPHYIYRIETKISQEGGELKAKEVIELRERQTRQKRWEQLDEEEIYSGKELDKSVVNPSQIRNIIRTLRDKWKDIFPDRNELPKTLIFAKSDSHAEDIVTIVKEEFGESNEFCKKVTYNSKDDPDVTLRGLRSDYNPRIAVTVDMIATGTDVKSLEILLFMRDVRSKTYYEQMFGRGTRTLGKDHLKQASPSADFDKSHFVIMDAVGVTESQKIDPRPFETKPGVSLNNLMRMVTMGATDEETFLSLANRLIRLEKQMKADEKQRFAELANGNKSIGQTIKALLTAHDPDEIVEHAKKKFPEVDSLNNEHLKVVKDDRTKATRFIFNGELNEFIENVKRQREQIIDHTNIDQVTFAGWGEQATEKAEETIIEFESFVAENKDKIVALRILYEQPYRRRGFTYSMIKQLKTKLLETKPNLAITTVWEAYKRLENKQITNPATELTALVALVRRAIGLDKELITFETTVNANFKEWIFKKNAGPQQFNPEQTEWLRMMKDYIANSMYLGEDDFENSPFVENGGLMKAWKLFGNQTEEIIEELNNELVA